MTLFLLLGDALVFPGVPAAGSPAHSLKPTCAAPLQPQGKAK
jgi:hypothetical protein